MQIIKRRRKSNDGQMSTIQVYKPSILEKEENDPSFWWRNFATSRVQPVVGER